MKARQHYYFFLALVALFSILFFAHHFLPESFRKHFYQLPAIDTLGHIIGFFILTWVCHSIIKLSLRICVPLLIFYAALTEIGQSYLSFRKGEAGDYIADVIGVLLFVMLKWLYQLIRQKKMKHTSSTIEQNIN